MRIIANIISYVFHPVFIISYMLIILMMSNPFAFSLSSNKGMEIFTLSVFFLTVFFPLLATVLLKFLGLVKSINMEERKDRIIPLVTSGLFYMWLFINIKSNPGINPMFSNFVLGSTIAVFLGVIFNNFLKISLHTISMGGILMGLILTRFTNGYEDFIFKIFDTTTIVHFNIVLIIVTVIAGVVGTSRLTLNAHSQKELYLGYAVGAFAQIIAYRFFMM